MSSLKIVVYPDPVLLQPGEPVHEPEFGAELQAMADDMFAIMEKAGGIGLAAPQVGISKRLFVMDVPREGGNNDRLVAVNPEIVRVEGEHIREEGCLSFPGLFQVVKREMRIIARAQDINGDAFEVDLSELSARCFLHETDHCDGIVFLDRMTPLKRQLAKRKIKNLRKTGAWV
jgi:peptide deformylase